MFIKPEIQIYNIEVTDIIVTSFTGEIPLEPGLDWDEEEL